MVGGCSAAGARKAAPPRALGQAPSMTGGGPCQHSLPGLPISLYKQIKSLPSTEWHDGLEIPWDYEYGACPKPLHKWLVEISQVCVLIAIDQTLLENLISAIVVELYRVVEAMKKVDRIHYLPPNHQKHAPIGFGATISAPHMHANALENLSPFLKPGARVLDVGSGSGYMLACFHHLSKGTTDTSTGLVLGIEHIPELSEQSIVSLRKDGLSDNLERSEIRVVCGDGSNPDPKLGGGWDVIHVGAAAPQVPEALLSQLKTPGRMFIPVKCHIHPDGLHKLHFKVGEDDQAIYQIDKHPDGTITQNELYGVRYVPLTDQNTQLRST